MKNLVALFIMSQIFNIIKFLLKCVSSMIYETMNCEYCNTVNNFMNILLHVELQDIYKYCCTELAVYCICRKLQNLRI